MRILAVAWWVIFNSPDLLQDKVIKKGNLKSEKASGKTKNVNERNQKNQKTSAEMKDKWKDSKSSVSSTVIDFMECLN